LAAEIAHTVRHIGPMTLPLHSIESAFFHDIAALLSHDKIISPITLRSYFISLSVISFIMSWQATLHCKSTATPPKLAASNWRKSVYESTPPFHRRAYGFEKSQPNWTAIF
jgi:hypothetical protein